MKENKNKKIILVTGGAGFIGSNLCERLSMDENNYVYSLDNYFTGTKYNHVNNVTYIKGETEDISKLVTFNPEIIYHLGEYSRVEQSFDDMQNVWRSNVKGTFAVLEFVRRNNCKLVYAGSSTKFGDSGQGKSASPYAWSKASNTDLVMNYGKWYGIKYAITYFYNAYGKREISDGKYATLIALFKKKIINNEVLTVVRPGTQQRNFTHIEDIIDGLIIVGKKGEGDGFGIGSKETYSVLEIAHMFKGKIKMLPERKGNRMSAEVITSKTEKLGWKAKKSVRDYIMSVVEKNP